MDYCDHFIKYLDLGPDRLQVLNKSTWAWGQRNQLGNFVPIILNKHLDLGPDLSTWKLCSNNSKQAFGLWARKNNLD